jgi:hypothetical protein
MKRSYIFKFEGKSKGRPEVKVGDTWNRLTIISEAGGCGNMRRVKCRCACGTVKTVNAHAVRLAGTTSCGCYRREQTTNKNKKPPTVSAFNSLFLRYRAAAQRKRLQFKLTKEQFLVLVSRPCCYCGTSPETVNRSCYGRDYYDTCLYTGVDRKDNTLGYTVENSVPCCKWCNYAKGERSFEEFHRWARGIAQNLGSFGT